MAAAKLRSVSSFGSASGSPWRSADRIAPGILSRVAIGECTAMQ